MPTEGQLNLEMFYPKTIKIISNNIKESTVKLNMKSITSHAVCPLCHQISSHYHSTYHRTIQDLPLLGYNVELDITAYRYYCENSECGQKVFAEELEGFTGTYRRKTERLEQLILSIAMNTSCEGCSRICHEMGIRVSGDSVIRLLTTTYEGNEHQCGCFIGIDDFAYKKGQTYGTVICDGDSHNPVEILDGRDGTSFKQRLKKHQFVRTITRDRASAYAKVISEVLPEAIQIADRFHLYQNLMKAVQDALARELPNKIRIANQINDVNLINKCSKKK